jgi:hypothetical protein
MAIKTFTSGEVLTAADTNTYLANSGLVFVKSQTIGSGVSSVTVSDVFSATYDNYRVMVSFNDNSAGAAIRMSFSGITASEYYTIGQVLAWATSVTNSTPGSATSWEIGQSYPGFQSTAAIEIYNPFRSDARTFGVSQMPAPGVATSYLHQIVVNTSVTALVVSPASGTITGGTITVYGYRKG